MYVVVVVVAVFANLKPTFKYNLTSLLDSKNKKNKKETRTKILKKNLCKKVMIVEHVCLRNKFYIYICYFSCVVIFGNPEKNTK